MATSGLPMPGGGDTASIGSVSDMLSMVPPDLFADVTDTSGDDYLGDDDSDSGVEPEAEVADDDTSLEAPEDGDEEPESGEEIADDEEPAAEEPAPAAEAATEELPEGVRKGKDRKGKDGYFLEENRYQTFHGHHKMVQQAAEVIGEPLTPEALKLRHDAYLGQERMFTNLTSGDPVAQSDVVSYMLKEMAQARESGEVGIDPSVPFAESVYNSLKEHSPDGYTNLRLAAARDLVGEIFDTAARSGNQNLFSAAQHFAATIAGVGPKPAHVTPEEYAAHIRSAAAQAGIPFYVGDEMQSLVKEEDPLAAKDREIADLRSKLSTAPKQDAAAQFANWNRSNITSIKQSVLDSGVKPSLAAVEEAWKNFPDDYQSKVIDPLHKKVMESISSDTDLNQRAQELKQQAQRATSEQVRQRIADQMKALYVNRAKLAADKAKPGILKDAAEWLKWRSQQTHERRSAAQSRTAPKGPSAPVKTPAVPIDGGFKNNIFDPAAAARMAAQAIKSIQSR